MATPALAPEGRLTGRPLLDTRADMALYLPRPELEDVIRQALGRGLNVLLDADRGAGKTTLLRALQYRARQDPDGPDLRYLTASSATSVTGLLGRLAGELTGREVGWDPSLPAEDALRRLADSLPAAAEADPLDGLDRSARADRPDRPDRPERPDRPDRPDRPLVILLDDLDPTLGHQLFGVLRDLVWQVPVRWLVGCDSLLVSRLLAPPADAFFDVRVGIAELTQAEALRLLGLRLGRDLSGLDVGPMPGNPRQLLRLAAAGPPQEWGSRLRAMSRRLDVAADLGQPAVDVVQALEDLGPVSPSDERLLTRLGWSRARASQVLGALAKRGVVTFREVRADRPGRPNRVYQLTSLAGGAR